MTNEQRELVERLRNRHLLGDCVEAATTIEQLAERCKRLRATLLTYGAHRPSCPRSARPPGAATCICGLHDLLASKAETEVKPSDATIAIAAELAECRNSRQREHDLRVTLAGELESFKIRYQDEVNARVDAENDRDTLRAGFASELKKAKAELATARIAALARQGDGR